MSVERHTFLDTNVVVRYLTGEPRDLAETAGRFIADPRPLLLTDGVLSEVAYVLLRRYEVPRETVVDTLISFVRRANIKFWGMDKDIVIQALLLCRPSGRVSFADALLWAVARSAGSDSTVVTLDARFPRVGIAVESGE